MNKLDYISENQMLKAELEQVKAERDKAVGFIKYLDFNYSGYMSEDKRFSQWRGRSVEK